MHFGALILKCFNLFYVCNCIQMFISCLVHMIKNLFVVFLRANSVPGYTSDNWIFSWILPICLAVCYSLLLSAQYQLYFVSLFSMFLVIQPTVHYIFAYACWLFSAHLIYKCLTLLKQAICVTDIWPKWCTIENICIILQHRWYWCMQFILLNLFKMLYFVLICPF